MNSYKEILKNVLNGKRLELKDALFLYKEATLPELGSAANKFREKYKHDNVATFIIDRNINYTNVCISHCSFCAFYRERDASDAYVLSDTEVLEKVEEAYEAGATQIMLQGGLHPDLPFEYYINMLRRIKSSFKNICIHSFSPPEVIHFTKISNFSIPEVLAKLKEAGLDSIPGGGAEILVDHVRVKISPKKISGKLWLEVMEQAHKSGFKSTATMMMGSIESIEDRLLHLDYIRSLQDKTNGFRAFIPWIFQPGFTELGGKKTSTYDYLKTLSISRLFLDNVSNIQGSWVTCGKDIGQLSLWYGANDLGSIMLEENVVKATGISYKISKNEMVQLIRNAKRIPAQRNTEYKIIETYRD